MCRGRTFAHRTNVYRPACTVAARDWQSTTRSLGCDSTETRLDGNLRSPVDAEASEGSCKSAARHPKRLERSAFADVLDDGGKTQTKG